MEERILRLIYNREATYSIIECIYIVVREEASFRTLYTLRSFILQKTSESDFRGEMASCLDVAAQLNRMLQDGSVPRPPV